MTGWKVTADVEARVRERARARCEYCHTDERWQYVRFTIDHVRPRAAGGSDGDENLALACFHCNRHKWDHATAEDPETGERVALFDPRGSAWSEHFRWSTDGLRVEGVTPTGRATSIALQMNRGRAVQIREADVVVGRHPPADDPVAR